MWLVVGVLTTASGILGTTAAVVVHSKCLIGPDHNGVVTLAQCHQEHVIRGEPHTYYLVNVTIVKLQVGLTW